MPPEELSRLLDEQFKTLATLVRMSQTQIELIDESRMTELVTLLSKKTPLIERLRGNADKINQTDLARIPWPNPSDLDRARKTQGKCQQLGDELMRIEAQCETALIASRETMSRQIAEFEQAATASQTYVSGSATMNTPQVGGGNLDLSCD